MAETTGVLMYGNAWCPYCSAARALLRARQAPVTEIDVETEPRRRAEMIERSGRTSVPQIFIGPTHIGGYDDLVAAQHSGRLDALLAPAPPDPERP